MLESVGDRQKKEKRKQQETYQIPPAQLFHDNNLQGTIFFNDIQYENLIISLFLNRHNKNLLGVRAPAVACECVLVMLSYNIYMKDIQLSLQFIQIFKKNE